MSSHFREIRFPHSDSVYEPEAFVTKALHQSKVECTWDETDRERTRVTRRKFDKDELEALDLKVAMELRNDEMREGVLWAKVHICSDQ